MIQKNLLIFFLAISVFSFSQTLPSTRSVDWSSAGLQTANISSTFQHINMEDFSVVGDGITANDTFLANAIASITGSGAILNFPEGTFLFKKPIVLTSNMVIKGKRSDKTVFKINLTTKDHGIKIKGALTSITTTFSAPSSKGNSNISVTDATNFTAGNWIEIIQNDSDLIDPSSAAWASESVGQIVQINSVSGNTINLVSPLRMDYITARTPYIKKINQVENVGVECLKIERIDDTDPNQSANIFFQYAVNSWVKAIESNKCTNAHVDIRKSSNLYISNSYFHHGFSYGGGGRAYGVILQSTTNETLVENNVFEHLRHSMLLQTGANGNVFSYNFSTDPYWDEAGFATDKAGDLVLHGNYPYANLFEMNIGKTVVVDNSHLANGPYNTFFRNRLEGYGIFFSESNSPSQNFIGNDITNTSLSFFDSLFTYFFQGSDHFKYGNNNKGTIDPSGSNSLADKSYYYSSKPDFVSSAQWASIGTPNSLSAASIPAKDRFTNNTFFKDCCTNYWTGTTDTDWNNTTNWDNGEPTNELDIIIASTLNQPLINSPVIINNIEIETGASLNINSNGSLTVNDNLTNKGTFTINNGGSLIVLGTSSGNIIHKRNLPTQDKWYLVASPFSGETIENVIANHIFATGTASNIGLATYNNTETDSNKRWFYQTPSSTGSLKTGKGFSVRLASPGYINFKGTINNTDVLSTISKGAGNAYNLLGNPYSSYINSATFLTTNTSKLTSQTLWVWNEVTSNYNAKVTANEYIIAPGQGFFIHSNQQKTINADILGEGYDGNYSLELDTIVFAKTNQSHQFANVFKKNGKIPKIKIHLLDKMESKYIEIFYSENATKGFDNGYDGELFGGLENNFEIYTHLLSGNEEKKFQIQSLPLSDIEHLIIPLGIKALAGKEITISIETLNLPANLKIFLEDRYTNTYKRLDEPSLSYTTTLSKDETGIGRFYIHNSYESLNTSDIAITPISIYCKYKKLYFKDLPSGNTRIKIYNTLGKLILDKKLNSKKIISLHNLPNALYIAHIETIKGSIHKKFLLK